MNKQTLSLKLLQLLADGLPWVDSQIPTYINDGGCGVFAYDLSSELDKMGLDYKIICLFSKDDEKEFNAVKDLLESGKLSPKLGCAHVCILIEDKFYIDSTGIINGVALSYPYNLPVTREQLKILIDNKGVWNDVFDRSTEADIKTKIDEVFSQPLEKFDNHTFKMGNGIELTPYTKEHIRNHQARSIFAQLMS